MHDIKHFKIRVDGVNRAACSPKDLKTISTTTDRDEVTCRSCLKSLAFRQTKSKRIQVSVTLSGASPKALEWLDRQPDRSSALVLALNAYVEGLK